MTVPIPAILQDDIGLVNFSLVQGVSKSIKVDLLAVPQLDISGWSFEVSFFVGRPAVKTSIITSASGAITVDAVNMSLALTFSAASIAAITAGQMPWDLRYTTGSGAKGQLLKGAVTLGLV